MASINMEDKIVLLISLALLNMVNFILYGIDKNRARKNKNRIAEKTFYTLGLLAGGIGGLLGMKVFHHKTKHLSFYIVNILGLILLALILYLY